jgi:SAM-dependent methyltransferase
MNPLIRRRSTCRLCNSSTLACILKLARTPVGEGYVTRESLGVRQEDYPVDLFLCDACGNVQLSDIISPTELYRHYIYKTSHSLGLVQHFDQYAQSILEQVRPAAGSLVVDLGSNDGSLLKAFKNRGMQVIGVDPAAEIAAEATASGVRTYPDFFTAELGRTIRKNHGAASLITMNNAFANIDDLHEIVRGVRELLAADGVFVFETGYGLDVVQKVIFDNIYHEHLNYFAVKPAQSYFASNDLELVDVRHVPTKGGSIRCMVQRRGGPRQPAPSVSAHIRIELDADLFDPSTYTRLASRIRTMRDETLGYIKSLKAKGRKIAGYGASVTVTGVLFNFDLDGSLIDYLVDDNPVRHGLYSPGMHIPVYPSSKLLESNPDYVVLLAWQYAKPILAKQARYLQNGGNFLLFQPYVRVVNSSNIDSQA